MTPPSPLRRFIPLLIGGLLIASASPTLAAKDRFDVEIRIIEAQPGTGKKSVAPALRPLARDLRSLPFQTFRLHDDHRVTMEEGRRISFQFPGEKGKKKKRFLVVTAHGKQRDGKMRFQMSIQGMNFDTLVAVPSGGTIIVGGPRRADRTLLFAVTARKATAELMGKQRTRSHVR